MPDSKDLYLIAKNYVDRPLNKWPDHNNYHSRTLLGNWLHDEMCLRCHLERLLAEKLRESKDNKDIT